MTLTLVQRTAAPGVDPQRHAVDERRIQGERLGQWVFERALRPVR